MAQMEQTRAYFDVTNESEEKGFVDTAAVMTAMNHKQYHHTSMDGTALCYRILVTAIKGSFTFTGAPHSFPTANAVKKTCAGWKTQMHHAGIRANDLPTYGKRARFALSRFGYSANSTAISGELIFENSVLHLDPLQSPGGDKWFPAYTASDGTIVQFRGLASGLAGTLSANQITQVTVTDQSVTPETSSQKPLTLLGTQSPEFSVISEWMSSRRSKDSYSEDTPGMDADSEMANLFSVSEEQSDEVIGGVEEYMDWRPYLASEVVNSPWVSEVEYCNISSITSAATFYPQGSAVIDVPLGLFDIQSNLYTDSPAFQIDVLAIYEM